MTKRDVYSDNEHSILYAETGGCCPLCKLSILFKKSGSKRTNKGYEVAHIYPLNPNLQQAKALVGYPVPDVDVINALDNVIALCPTCHTKYDKDFQIEEYKTIREIKNRYLSEAKAKKTASEHAIEEEVCSVLDEIVRLSAGKDILLSDSKFNFAKINSKLDKGMSPLQVMEIKNYAVSFYVRIKEYLRKLEQQDQVSVKIIQTQINAYYLMMSKQNPDNKDLVFIYIAEWISSRTGRDILAAKVLTSFFVQNCEVFDVSSK